MKWFDRWFAKKCNQAWEDANTPQEELNKYENRPRISRGLNTISAPTRGITSDLNASSTTFNLYHANGGYVVELRRFDEHRDEWKNALHIIPNGEELGKTIEHIITLEALKK